MAVACRCGTGESAVMQNLLVVLKTRTEEAADGRDELQVAVGNELVMTEQGSSSKNKSPAAKLDGTVLPRSN